jgi:hypothetical protein
MTNIYGAFSTSFRWLKRRVKKDKQKRPGNVRGDLPALFVGIILQNWLDLACFFLGLPQWVVANP